MKLRRAAAAAAAGAIGRAPPESQVAFTFQMSYLLREDAIRRNEMFLLGALVSAR